MAILREDENGAYHRALLLTSVFLMGLPWAVSEYDNGTYFAPFMTNDQMAGFGCMLFVLGALVYRESDTLGAALQSGGLLAFSGSEHVDMTGAFWMAVIYIVCVWALIMKPDLLDRLLDREPEQLPHEVEK